MASKTAATASDSSSAVQVKLTSSAGANANANAKSKTTSADDELIVQRDQWSSKLDFILSCVGYAIGKTSKTKLSYFFNSHIAHN